MRSPSTAFSQPSRSTISGGGGVAGAVVERRLNDKGTRYVAQAVQMGNIGRVGGLENPAIGAEGRNDVRSQSIQVFSSAGANLHPFLTWLLHNTEKSNGRKNPHIPTSLFTC
jgi:hypothetical protein